MNNQINFSVRRGFGGVYTTMAKVPGAHLLFIGALACMRHRSFEMLELQRQGRLSFLCLDEVDFITGSYLNKIEQAVIEIAEESHPSCFLLTPGCQSALLSTDYDMMAENLEKITGVPVRVHASCHLCGFASETSAGKPDSIEGTIFDFLEPREKSAEKTVNIIASSPLDSRSELFDLLKSAGVKAINEINSCDTFEEYRRMASAHLNIICCGNSEVLGNHLEEKLGIPYVILDNIYSCDELTAAYDKISEILGAKIDISQYTEKLNKRISEMSELLSGSELTVEGSPEAAKWFTRCGFPVSAVAVGGRFAPDPRIVTWFRENAPQVSLVKPRGFGGQGGKPEGRYHGGRPNGHPGRGHSEHKEGRNGGKTEFKGRSGKSGGFGGRAGQPAVKVGFLASESLLNELNDTLREGNI